MDKLAEMTRNVKEGGSVAELLAQMVVYEELSLPHFKQEEVECLPLMRAYFTPKEIAVQVQKIVAKGPKVEMGSFIAAMVSFARIARYDCGVPGRHVLLRAQVLAHVTNHLTILSLRFHFVFQGIENFRNEFMKQEGIPGFVWYLQFNGNYIAFHKQFSIPVEAVKSGNEPAGDTPWWSRIMR